MLDWLQRSNSKLRRNLQGAPLHRMLGDRIFHHDVWSHDRHAVGGGLALGLFIAFTPTIPAQMLLAAFGAFVFRVNIGLAVAACWVTNPFTVGPVYYGAWRLGRFLLEEVALIEDLFNLFSQETRFAAIVRQSAYLWSGSLVLATAAALSGYLTVTLLWFFLSKAASHVAAKRSGE